MTAATSTDNLDLVRSLGADVVIDYTKADPTTDGSRFDLIFDAGGWLRLLGERRSLRPGGTAVNAGAGKSANLLRIVGGMASMSVLTRLGNRRFVSYLAHRTQDDLEVLRSMLAAGTIRTVIDRRFSLAEVSDAIRYQKMGHARGKVIVRIG